MTQWVFQELSFPFDLLFTWVPCCGAPPKEEVPNAPAPNPSTCITLLGLTTSL